MILVTGPLILGAARLWLELPLLGGVALLLLLQGLRLTRSPASSEIRRADAIDISVMLFVLYTIGRWLTSPAEYFSRIEAMDVMAYAVIFFTCRYGISSRRYGLALLFILVGLGVLELIFGYYLSHHLDWFPFGVTERLHLYYFPRWTGTYGCPNHYGSILVMAIGAALALGCFSKLAWPMRIFLFYLAGMMMVGVMFSLSRGSYLALMASVGALTFFGLRHGTVRWWVPVTAAVLLIVAGIYLFSQSSDVRERVGQAQEGVMSGNLSNYIRVQLARDAMRITADHPVWGTGPGTFVFVHPRYQDNTFVRKAVLAHNDYLNCLADYGIVGFGIAIFFVAAVTFAFLGPLWADHRWQDRVIIAAGFAAWSAYLVHSLVDFNLHIPANALLLFALVGLGLGRLRRDEAVPHWSTLSLSRLGSWFGWSVVILSLFFGAEACRTALGDITYEQVYNHWDEVPINNSIQDAEQSLVYDPNNVQDIVFLGDLHRYQASRKEDIEDRVSEGQKAMDYYRQAIKLNSLDDTISAKMGLTFDIMRRYAEAYFSYKQAVTEQPYNGQFWYWLGNHYWQRGMLDKAEQAYLRAAKCPHGKEGSLDAINELRALPGRENAQDVSAPLEDSSLPEQPPAEQPSAEQSQAPAEMTTSPDQGTPYDPSNHPPTVP